MLSIQREETKQKPMKISYNSEENGRPERRILNNIKKEKKLASNWNRVWARGRGDHIVNDSTFELCSAYQ